MIITCCIVTKSNSIFFKRSLANITITSSLRMLTLWNKMYQDFCCCSDLKDVKTRRRKRRVIILSTAAPELEFYNGRRSFLAIEIHVGNSDLDSHLFWLIKKSYFELLTKLNIEITTKNRISCILKSLLIKIEFNIEFQNSIQDWVFTTVFR